MSLGSWGLPAGVVVGPRIKQAPLLAYRSPKFRTCVLHGFNIEMSNFFNRMRGPQSIEHKPARNSNNCNSCIMIYFSFGPKHYRTINERTNKTSMQHAPIKYKPWSIPVIGTFACCVTLWPHILKRAVQKKRKGLWNKMTKGQMWDRGSLWVIKSTVSKSRWDHVELSW